jgi:hypothetical protein
MGDLPAVHNHAGVSRVEELDTDSQSAFPSLAAPAPSANVPAKSAWGTASGPRIKPVVQKQPVFTDSFTLSAIDLSNTGKDGKLGSLGEVMKQVMAKYKVKLQASGNQKARKTTFHVKADTQKDLDKAKRSLLSLLSPAVSWSLPCLSSFCSCLHRLRLFSMHLLRLSPRSLVPKVSVLLSSCCYG